jgi:hypothetical protein
MRTSGSSYKMSKQTKTGLALGRFRSREERNAWKRAMVKAEVIAAAPAPTRPGRGQEK